MLIICSLHTWGCSYPGKVRKDAVEENGMGSRYIAPVFPRVVVHEDLQYGEAKGYSGQRERLFLDLYEPEGDVEKNRPAVLLIHGGGFGHGDKQQDLYVAMARKFARRGYVALSIDYRLVDPKNQDKAVTVLDTAVVDALMALEWLRGHAEQYGIDPEKIAIGGDSAGGAIAVHVCFRNAADTGVAACIDLWGGMFRRGERGWGAPIYPDQVEPGTPPTLVIHGTEDPVVPQQTSMDLAKKLSAAKIPHELHLLPGAKHYPESRAGQFVPIMIEFVYRHLVLEDQ